MQLTVVIPVLNEQGHIAETIRRTRAAGDCELIVVDGGSTDRTVEHSAACDLLIESSRGRAVQMNAGARRATGDVLLFLHADCWLEPGSFDQIRRGLADRTVVAGCFHQSIEHPNWRYRIVESGNALRVSAIGWIYGDQGLFVRRDLFETLGGFPDLPVMEDLYFSKKLRGCGKLQLLPGPIHVNPRRWERTGLVRQTLLNWRLILQAHCGVPISRLASEYRHVR